MNTPTKVPCGGFQIGTGLSLKGRVLSVESTGGGIMSFETIDEYVEYCKEHGSTVACVTQLTGADNPANVAAPLLCLYMNVETIYIEGVVNFYRVGAIDGQGFMCRYIEGGGTKPTLIFTNNAILLRDSLFYQFNLFNEQLSVIKRVFSTSFATGIDVNFNKVQGYYLDNPTSTLVEPKILKSYNGKTTVTVNRLDKLDENGFDYTVTINE